ncbi:phage antirepressor KilAC domain-containing protein [Aminobacter niigataensis]|uniref:phage antirepressor KilAC domain-containing protein n=1 Tax=Aminobacter niigataensis TaxID=83265 RepID=UPI0024C80D0C|nr:phage antirepressor KilAC domain-containing protein [Aminobacter niigataensis]CAI2936065.1 Phage anti-repressor protein [Aminobacter niigataensis]
MTNSFPLVSLGTVGGSTVQTVNARDLHAFLQVGTRFNDWIASRVEQYGFVEGSDFASFTENTVKGRPAIEYAITIDMAKELSMVERNEQGKRARQYFIECERRAKDPVAALSHVPTLRQLLLDNVEKVISLESRVAELLPSHDALQRIAEADGSLCITEAAKALQMRPKDLFSWLRQNGWIYRRPGSGHDLGYQSKTTNGLLEHKVTTVLRSDGSEKVSEQVRVTPKGLTKLASLIKPALGAVA